MSRHWFFQGVRWSLGEEQDGIGNDENDDEGGLFGNETLNVENGNTLVEEETDEYFHMFNHATARSKLYLS